jgi:hypothetical protein
MSALRLGSLALLLAAAGCDAQKELPVAQDMEGDAAKPPPPPEGNWWSPHGQPSDMAAPKLTPEAEKGEKGARNVLLEWARAVERKDFARAAAQWGKASAVTARSEADRFTEMGQLTVSVGEGQVEGGAGSLYYGVPITVTDGKRSLTGEIVLRRVNDVEGASPAQLRWHIFQLNLNP